MKVFSYSSTVMMRGIVFLFLLHSYESSVSTRLNLDSSRCTPYVNQFCLLDHYFLFLCALIVLLCRLF